MDMTFSNTINGQAAPTAQVTQGISPSTRQKLWDVPVASKDDIELAVSSARTAFTEWSQTTWEHRQQLLLAAHKILEEKRQEMAELLTKEGGKPIQFAQLEVEHALGYLMFNASQSSFPEKIIQDDGKLRLSLVQKPMGVVVAICPWNYPLVLAMGKIAAALITGNCVIVKPSPFTPYSILKFTEWVRHLFPAGVFQSLNGDDLLGPTLCRHENIDKISFTGSTATGKKVAVTAAEGLKPVTLELGGNNASIICPDVDPKVVAPQVAVGCFFNSGQLCVASKRVYVHEDIYDEFLKVMVETVRGWKVAPTASLEQGIMLGPVQNKMQYDIVRQFFKDATENGHQFAVGKEPEESNDNFVIHPAIIDNPPDDSLVVTGEAFGPIVPLLKWTDEDDVIKRANNTLSGLGGAVWSNDLARARKLANKIEAGTVWINSFEKPLPQAHLAGYKESGLGGEWGREGLLSYCKPQVVHQYAT